MYLFFFRMGGIPAVNGKGERLLLYIGIIDILQSFRCLRQSLWLMPLTIYIKKCVIHFCQCDLEALWNNFIHFLFRLIKKLEHTWKALVHDGVRNTLNFIDCYRENTFWNTELSLARCSISPLWKKSFGQVNIQLCFQTLWSLTFNIIPHTSFIFILIKHDLPRYISMNGI